MQRVYIFAKPPRPGVSKTRLARGVGDERAAAFAGAFLRDTVDRVREAGGVPVLSTTQVEADFGLPDPIKRVEQGGGSLGERLERVVRIGLQESTRSVVLGADSPGIPVNLLRALLTASRATVIPAADGGFVGLALRSLPDGLFEGITWSAASTLEELSTRADRLEVPLLHLDPWFDIDHVEDLVELRRRTRPEDCPTTYGLLD